MKAYIRSSACISPQNTFGDDNCLKAIEPDYKEFIDPKSLRRMSHIIKMGVAAAMKCLKNGNTEMPGAIITGTAYGCLEDTITFLTQLIRQDEEMLPPTAFIQSTHNTVAAQIALMLKCHQYNTTYVHKGISFESALLDAMMLLQENEADNILLGGIDEITDTSFKVLSRLGLFKRLPVSNLDLFATKSKGTIGGEGAAFFLLTNKDSANNLAEILALKTFYKPTGLEDIEKRVKAFLSENSLIMDDIELVINGRSGDTVHDDIYDQLNGSIFKNVAVANYKHLSGEYPTSVAFALWIAASISNNKTIPVEMPERASNIIAPRRILIYNHYQQIYHSLILVSAI